MKGIDLFLGIKAEQTLRDAVRAANEEQGASESESELCPVGQKDWIAGRRIGSVLSFKELATKKDESLKSLIGLGSHQRIRRESIRVYAVKKPVPVFKDPLPESLGEEPEEETTADDNSATCPVCGATVHTYNIQYDPWGKMVGCYLCRGDHGAGNNGK